MIGCLKVSIFGVFGCVSLVSSLAWIALEPKSPFSLCTLYQGGLDQEGFLGNFKMEDNEIQ